MAYVRRMLTRPLAGLALLTLLAACSGGATATTATSGTTHGPTPILRPLHQAVNACGANPLYADLRARDRTLVLDGKGANDTDGLSTGTITCILDALGAGAPLLARIMSTGPEDHIQNGSWSSSGGDYKITWSSLPGPGLMVIVQEA